MRATLVFVVLCAVAAAAAADSKTRELARGYEKELAACQTRSDGVTKVATGAQALVDDGQKQYEADLAALRDGLTQMQAYCAEVTATLELLRADPNAKYRSLERKLDEQDNKIRKLRQSTRKLLDDLAPVISRLIPAINARVGSAAPAPKKLRLRLPSGRTVDGPALGGTFRTSGSEGSDIVEYTEAKTTATLTTKLVAGATCEQQRQTITTADARELAATEATKSLGLAWYLTYAKRTRRLRVACRMTKAGALVGTLDDPLAASEWPELEPLLAAMIAARP